MSSSGFASLTSAIAAAESGVAQAEIAYELTDQVVGQNNAEVVFPLIALSLEAAAEGLAMYAKTELDAAAEKENIKRQLQPE